MNIITPTLEPNFARVIGPQLDHLKARITQYDAAIRAASRDLMGYIYLTGLSLNQAKSLLPHGQFGPWCEAQCPALSNGSIHNYMDFADRLNGKFPTVGNLALPLLLTPGDPDKTLDPIRTQVLEAVHDVTDGKTITKIYRALGVIRDPAAPGGFRPNEQDVQAWLKVHHPSLLGTKYLDLPKEIQAAFKAQWRPKPHDPAEDAAFACDSGRALAAHLTLILDQTTYAHWDDPLRFEILNLLDSLRQALKACSRSRGPKPAKAKK